MNCCKELLKGKVAVVTGAAQGLGKTLAVRLNNEGAKVVVADLNYESAKEVAKQLNDALAVKVDVTDKDEVENMIKQAVDRYEKLDIMVSNAGIVVSGAIDWLEPELWMQVVKVNLYGYYLCARAAANVMIPNKQGVIIQINSKSGKKGSSKNSAYAASKFAGIGFTQSLALELAPYNIRVNAICPGNLLDSPLWKESLFEQYARNQNLTVEKIRDKYLRQVPLGRGCTYDDVSNVLVFLSSHQSSYMTGQAINVTGGQEMR